MHKPNLKKARLSKNSSSPALRIRYVCRMRMGVISRGEVHVGYYAWNESR